MSDENSDLMVLEEKNENIITSNLSLRGTKFTSFPFFLSLSFEPLLF